MKILVIEDEKKIASFIKKGLEDESCQVTLSYDGVDGLNNATSGEFDLIIIDIMLPKMDGLAVLSQVRGKGMHVPVLMLTAKTETIDIVTGLDSGADDYLAKPFAFAELQARVKALIRKSVQSRGSDIRCANLRIDPVDHRVWRDKAEIKLSGQEYQIIAYLVRNAEVTVSRQEIADNCWDEPIAQFSNIVDVYINYLRKKVDEPFSPKLIHTVRGQGYVLKDKDSPTKQTP
ncbi:MAG: response regulator transcription factor [Desulfuromonadaceae bacterium]